MEFAFSLGPRERSFIAAFLEGEATFTIGEANGSQSYYSEPGANLLVNAPSSGVT